MIKYVFGISAAVNAAEWIMVILFKRQYGYVPSFVKGIASFTWAVVFLGLGTFGILPTAIAFYGAIVCFVLYLIQFLIEGHKANIW